MFVLCLGTLLLLGGGRQYPSESEFAARSFVITAPQILEALPFERVIAALGATPAEAWLETLVPARDDRQQRSVVRPLAGFIAAMQDGHWVPTGASEWTHLRLIAIVNRFDLAPPDYAHCGEYRLIFSRATEGPARLHIAIETVLPNPNPDAGKAGCVAVAAFWWDLAFMDSDEIRRDRLERFFFEGVPAVPRALDREGFARHGRIRTSEIGDGRPRFRQYEMKRDCAPAGPCVAELTPVPLDNMPHAAFFGSGTGNEHGAFRREFLRQVASLAVADVNRYSMNIDRAYSVRDIESSAAAFNYRLPFRRSLRSDAGREFRERIAEELRKAGSTLTPEDVIDRAETQNCAGCHGKAGPVGGGLVFPKAFDTGEHIADDSLLEAARLSPALQDVFVPYRIHLLRDYLETYGRGPERVLRARR
jgi:mono/diheme cytochrome c family protein